MTETKPFVTVIMPVRNEVQYIQRSLRSVLAQDYPSDRLEILVVDGMSSDGTREFLEEQQHHIPNLYVLNNPGKIVPVGLNLAISRARGEILVRVDGHCEIAEDYISRCVDYLLKEEVVGVGGPMETIGETPVAQSIALAMSSPFGVGNSAFRTRKNVRQIVDTIPFPAYWTKTVREAGPFDETLVRNQDDEYNYRLRAMGGRLLLAPDVRSKYYSRSSFRSLWRQYFQYGFYKVRVLRKHPKQLGWRQFVPPVFVAALLMLPLLPQTRVIWLAMVIFYLLANLSVSISLAIRNGWHHLVRLPLAFLILHLAYGLGFWAGLVDWMVAFFRSRRQLQPGK